MKPLISGSLILILLVLSGCASVQAAREPSYTCTGFVEAETIDIASPTGGRVIALPFSEGDRVQAGDVLVHLDDRLAQQQLIQAEAQVAEAQARLDLARAGATPEQLDASAALVAQASAARAGACRIAELAQQLEENPQDLNRQISAAQAQVRAADAAYRAALALREAAAKGLQRYEELEAEYGHGPVLYPIYTGDAAQLDQLPPAVRQYLEEHPGPVETRLGDYVIIRQATQITVSQYVTVTLPVEVKIAPAQYEKAEAGVKSAAAARDGTRSVLALLYELRDNPTSIRTQVQQAALQCQIAQGNEAAALAALDGLRSGATTEELAALEAALKLAQAQSQQAQIALEHLTLRAPQAGLILERTIEVGELALPNATLLTLADLDTVYVTLYVPNANLGAINIGQRVSVHPEGQPETELSGEVIAIGTEAVFPPANVPQPDERAALVFEVRVRIPNPDQRLRPGMSVQVTFGPAS